MAKGALVVMEVHTQPAAHGTRQQNQQQEQDGHPLLPAGEPDAFTAAKLFCPSLPLQLGSQS